MAAERPDDPEPLTELGDMLRRKERFAEAVVAYDKAAERIPEFTQRHWPFLYARGIALERSKMWPRAEADFLKALELRAGPAVRAQLPRLLLGRAGAATSSRRRR